MQNLDLSITGSRTLVSQIKGTDRDLAQRIDNSSKSVDPLRGTYESVIQRLGQLEEQRDDATVANLTARTQELAGRTDLLGIKATKKRQIILIIGTTVLPAVNTIQNTIAYVVLGYKLGHSGLGND
ncbi:hypothetical protein BC567DRAFT_299632 [Phyllosticta citribraziliensis]